MSKRNISGLKAPWQPGQSGNPNGISKGTKHKGTILKEILTTELEASHPLICGAVDRLNLDPKKKYSAEYLLVLQSIADALTDKNLKRDRITKDLFDRLYGKPQETLQLDQSSEVRIVINSPYDPLKDPERDRSNKES